MKILGIVVEYNPFHTGHLYHLEKAKEIVQPDLTIAIMSGNYVQRGEVAIIDKFKRSELAIKYGVDLVIELPFVYVSQSADYFCKGAIDLLYHIGVTDLVFGSECGTIETFKEIAYAIEKQPDTYNQYVRDAMNQGLRYPDACNQALSQLLGKSIVTPNDLLGLGYVKEVIFNHYPINLH
ncbi:MAG: nucleotidyltransferase family protein, partial [Faecalibacillus faecis]